VGDGLPPVAQLKLLRALQLEVNQKTDAFQKQHPDLGKLNAKEKAELQAIRKDQQEIADLLEELTRPADEPGAAEGDKKMSRRLAPVLVAAAVAAGMAWADDPPPDPGDAPVRLKKKNKPDAANPDKPAPAKPPAGEEKDKKPKDQPKEEEPKGNPEPDQPEQDEKEVLQRVGKNMRSVEERLGNKELNEGTRQLQEDILKDLDSLIRMSQQQDNNDSSSDSSSSPDMGSKPSGSRQQGKQQAKSGGRRQQKNQMAKGRQKSGGQMQNGKDGGQQQDQMANNQGGNEGGGGGRSGDGPDKNADLYKDIWGHLPEALRAEMNAYSNPQPFMNKYDDLIKKYYTTIAEKGRKKGE
jgi:hypothetical protein